MTWAQFAWAAALTIAACTVLFVVELIAAAREFERRGEDVWFVDGHQ